MNTLQLKPQTTTERAVLDERASLFRPVEAYALRPVMEAFVDFEETLMPMIQEQQEETDVKKDYDLTVFYSKKRINLSAAAEKELVRCNEDAYAKAMRTGGLVVYCQGLTLENTPDACPDPALKLKFMPDCLSFCIWESRQQALAGADVEAHRKAASKAREWYEDFAVRKLVVLTSIPSADEPKSIAFRNYE